MRPDLRVIPKEKPNYVKVGDNLHLNTKTGFYYVRKSFRRYRIPDLFVTTKETKITKAKAKADQLIKEHMDQYLGKDRDSWSKRKGILTSAVIDEVLEVVTPTRRTRTQRKHRDYLRELKAEWGTWDISRVTLHAWSVWLTEFRKRKNRRTFMDYAKMMNLVLRYAYKQRYVSHLVALPDPDKGLQRSGRVFTHEEIKALWDAMNEQTRDQFVLCYECFMRLREALYLTWDRVDLERGIITLRAEDVKTGSKTGRGRAFQISSTALERLKRRRGEVFGKAVFPSPRDPDKPVNDNKHAWESAKKKAGIKGRARWHDIRHSALTHALLDSKTDPILVSEFAGVSLSTLQRVYLHSTHEKTAVVSKSVRIFHEKQ